LTSKEFHIYNSQLDFALHRKNAAQEICIEANLPSTRVLSDPTRRDFFLTPKRKKIEKFDVFRGNFPNSNPNHKWLTRPNPVKIF